jgi:periplasmic protein TonB
LDNTGLPGRRSVVPAVGSAQIIDLESARLALARDAGGASPATLGAVPLAFLQWREERERRSPRFHRWAWTAAAVVHAVIGSAVLFYVSLTTLPEALPMVAVTLSFEPAKPAPDPVATPTTETPPEEPPVPEQPVAAEPEPSPEIATQEPPPALPPPEPTPIEMPPPPPEPPVAATPDPPKPIVAAPPPPAQPAPRRPARPPAPPAKHQAPPPQAATDTPPAAPVLAPSPPPVEQAAALPIIPPSQVSGAAGNSKPAYPVAARRNRLEGRLVLRVEVTVAGSAAAVAVATSSGHSILDQAALDAVRAWRFNPATRGGVPVAGVAFVPIQFRLSD